MTSKAEKREALILAIGLGLWLTMSIIANEAGWLDWIARHI